MFAMVRPTASGILPALLLVAGSSAALAAEYDEARFQQGQEIYESECAQCHQAGGGGISPSFPALSGNERLEDLALIVDNMHRGRGAMPAFPHLDADQLAALATYIRNAWENEFGGADPEEVATLLEGLGDTGERASVWDGVYTEAQAERGESVFLSVCARCHGARGNGAGDPEMPAAPAVARAPFLRNWDGQSLATLFEYVRATMPTDNPASLSDQQYLDAIAQMLVLSNIPAGDEELVPDQDALSNVIIELEP